MAAVLRIIDRFRLTGVGTVYMIKTDKENTFYIGDIYQDLRGNHFKIKGIKMIRRMTSDVNFLFCNHPLYQRKVDEDYQEEYQTAGLNHACALFSYEDREVRNVVKRIAGNLAISYREVSQDTHLADNQKGKLRCGDNGIFKGMPLTEEQKTLTHIAKSVYDTFPFDGKYILDQARLILCQSNAKTEELQKMFPSAEINPLGDWTGGMDVDAGATNRKLGSDMADSVTGGGLHGKDLSKADVSVNIYAFLRAQKLQQPVEISCAIGDETIDGLPYSEIVEMAREYIQNLGGFEKFAEWGLVRDDDNN